MSAPPLRNLKLQELLEHNGVRVLFAATNTFCVYFKSPANAPTAAEEITVTESMLNRGLDPIRDAVNEVAIIAPKLDLRLRMDFGLPHRIDEARTAASNPAFPHSPMHAPAPFCEQDTVQRIELSELGSDGRALEGRLVFASKGVRGPEQFIVEAYNKRTGTWARNFVVPGQATMVAKITYQVVPDRWRERDGV